MAGADSGCKCAACLATDGPRPGQAGPYRYAAGTGRTVSHLALHASLPLTGMALIGPSWWALAPVLGSLAAYLANSFILCPSCAYHHAGVRSCGCYPKSVFPYRTYLGKRWGVGENLTGRTAAIVLTAGPAVAVLAAQGNGAGIVAVLFLTVVVIFLTSVISCPDCRQQDVCALGRLVQASIRRDNDRQG